MIINKMKTISKIHVKIIIKYNMFNNIKIYLRLKMKPKIKFCLKMNRIKRMN